MTARRNARSRAVTASITIAFSGRAEGNRLESLPHNQGSALASGCLVPTKSNRPFKQAQGAGDSREHGRDRQISFNVDQHVELLVQI